MENFMDPTLILKEIKRISLITTSEGPMYPDVFWLLQGNSDISIIPSEGADENFIEKVQNLTGFDNEKIINAMTSTDDKIFICWEKTTLFGQ